MGNQVISISKKVLIFFKAWETVHFCICIFCIYWLIGVYMHFSKFLWDISQTTLFDFLQKIWRIKTQNDLRNFFPPRLLEYIFWPNRIINKSSSFLSNFKLTSILKISKEINISSVSMELFYTYSTAFD